MKQQVHVLAWLGVSISLSLSGCGDRAVFTEPDAGDSPDVGAVDSGRRDTGAPDSGTDAGPIDECPDGCLVGDSCFPDGAPNPANACEICDVARAATGFSTNDGATCDDGAFCTTGDVCVANLCTGAARSCDDSIACNGVATCDEAASACAAGTPTCAGGQICDALSGSCVLECSGCLIDGTCYGDGQVDALNPCQVCTVAASRSAWSDNDGASCDDGLYCTVSDVCGAGVCGAGAARACDDGVDCDGAETCDEDANACAAGATTCATDELCDIGSDTCIATCTGCVIGGVCFGDGQANPLEQCQVCVPTTTRTGWSDRSGTCDDGAYCTVGDTCTAGACVPGTARACADAVSCNGVEACDETTDRCLPGTPTCPAGQSCNTATNTCDISCAGCTIAGVCYAAGTVNPSAQCQVCTPGSSSTAWSNRTGACDDNAYCTTGDTCSAGACVAGPTRACADGVSCNGTETCDEASDRCLPGTSTCGAGQSCNTATNACEITCAGCVIGGVCYAEGTRNPSAQCQVCTRASSAVAWTNRSGACDDGAYCTNGDTCSAGACVPGAARVCTDAIACNGLEVCNELTDRCDAGASTCTGGQICNTMTNMCVLSCVGGTTLCGGACVNTTYDPTNCGSCGMVCPATPNASSFCATSACRFSCNAGFADCSAAAPGCEIDTRTDSANCGGCGNVCGPGSACRAGACTTAFDGTTGPSWATLSPPLDNLYSLMTYQPADIARLYNMQPAVGQAYTSSTNSWVSLTSSAPYSGPWTTTAPWAGDLYMIRNGAIYFYDVSADTWATRGSYVGGDDLNMTESDSSGHIWGHAASGHMISYDVASSTVTTFPTGLGSEFETRMGYDPGDNAIFFGAYNTPNLYRFDLTTHAVTARTSIPESQLNDIFCSDRSGHIYAAGASSGVTMWQYTIATDTWVRIADLPADHGNNGSCTVSVTDRALYVGTGSNRQLFRISIGP